MTLTDEQQHILRHALGYKNGKPPAEPYRDHFAAYPENKDYADLVELEEMGFLKQRQAHPELYGDMHFFFVTQSGREIIEYLDSVQTLNVSMGHK